MDFATLATAAVTAAVPLLQKGGEAISTGVGKDLWELIKKPFKKTGDEASVQQLEQQPGDARLQGKVEGKLEELLKQDPELAAELGALLKPMPIAQQSNAATIVGDENINVQGTTNSTIHIGK